MQSDPSTLLVIAFLAFAASLASYSLAIAPHFRGNRPVAWTGFGIGTALLIVATTIMVLTTSHWTALIAQRGVEASAESATARVAIDFPQRGADSNAPAVPAPTGTSATARSALGAPARRNVSSRDVSGRDVSARRSSPPPSTEPRFSSDYRARLTSVQSAGPWGATRCVYGFRPDPADPTRWWLENDCNVAVAIVFASCTGAHCASASPSWKYTDRPMLLPAKSQRSVTHAEQTQYGEYIRYAACPIVTPSVGKMVGTDPVSRDAPGLVDPLRDDECVVGVQTVLVSRASFPGKTLCGDCPQRGQSP